MDAKGVAIRAAKEAGKIVLRQYGREKVVRFKDQKYNNIVTDVDLASEKKIVAILTKHFPSYNVLTEEKLSQKNGSAYSWIIDPIDGTTNYTRKIPLFAVAIGLARETELILAVAYDPVHDELFVAEKGRGAFLNGKRMRVSSNELDLSLVDVEWAPRLGAPPFYSALFASRCKLFTMRSSILSLCYVACGRFDASINRGGKPWDLTAALFVTEAGGEVTTLSGASFRVDVGEVLASNGKAHQRILAIIQKK